MAGHILSRSKRDLTGVNFMSVHDKVRIYDYYDRNFFYISIKLLRDYGILAKKFTKVEKIWKLNWLRSFKITFGNY